MKNKTILVTAGPTREKIDAIRYISNESSGQLGFEIAKEAKRQGFKVILILGPTQLPKLSGVTTIPIESAKELARAVKANIAKADMLVMSAAVADFTPVKSVAVKIKREKDIVLHLKKTEDILASVAKPAIKKDKIYIGFCIETEDLLARAKEKLQKKNLDYMVATVYKKNQSPFGSNLFSPLIINKNGESFQVPPLAKARFAKKLLGLCTWR